MTSIMGEQMTLQDLVSDSSKMFPDCSQATKEKTSVASSKRSAKSSTKMPLFLDLRKDRNGRQADASWSRGGLLLGDSQMLNIMEYRNEDGDLLSWVTSTDMKQLGFCLTLNLSECPRVANPTLLSEILEEDADPKYNLSAKACQGILNRANKRGKKLPEILQKALEAQAEI